MDTKLTLKLDKEVIDKAKAYAAAQQRSLSRLIEAYLKTLVEKGEPLEEDDIEISAYVKGMKTGIKLPHDYDYKNTYGKHLAEKYQ